MEVSVCVLDFFSSFVLLYQLEELFSKSEKLGLYFFIHGFVGTPFSLTVGGVQNENAATT